MSQKILKTTFAFFCFIFSSCDYHLAEKEAPGINHIQTKTKFRINLPEEHSSGYIWQLSENYDMTKVMQVNSVWHGPTKGVDFNFETLAAGQTTLTFILRKYNDTSDIKHFPVHIAME